MDKTFGFVMAIGGVIGFIILAFMKLFIYSSMTQSLFFLQFWFLYVLCAIIAIIGQVIIQR